MLEYFNANEQKSSYNTPFLIGLMSTVFTNGLGDLGSIPGWIIPKTQKMVLDAALLNTQHKVRIKGKWSNPEDGVVPSPTPRCSSYWKGCLRVTLDYGRQLYLLTVREKLYHYRFLNLRKMKSLHFTQAFKIKVLLNF